MASYNTTCTQIPNLTGTCVIENDECTSYNSNTLGAAKTPIPNTGSGTTLEFKVEFEVTNPSPPPANTKYKYKVTATLNGAEYDGDAEVDTGSKMDDIPPPVDPEPWTATATGEPVVAAKATAQC